MVFRDMFSFKAKHRSRTGEAHTPVRYRPSLDFSFGGLVYCCVMAFMGLAAVNTQANPLFAVFGLMIGVLLVSIIIGRKVLQKVRIQRLIPEAAIVGQPVTIYYEFTNRKRFWPSLSVNFAELEGSEAFVHQPVTYMLHTAAGMTSTVPMEVVPKRRGRHKLDRYQIATSFPFGFIKRALIRRQPDEMLVYPALGVVNPILLQRCTAVEKSGPTVRPQRGGLDEFFGVRPYRAGDNPRWIYWRRSARTGTLVTKEMTRVTPPRLVLIVDSCVSGRTRRSHAMVERTIAMAASIVNFAVERGLMVGMCFWANGWQTIAPQRGKRHRRDLLSTLSQLPLNTDHGLDELVAHAQPALQSGSTGVVLTPAQVQPQLMDRRYGNLVTISASVDEDRDLVVFSQEIDFRHCMPVDQDSTQVHEARTVQRHV